MMSSQPRVRFDPPNNPSAGRSAFAAGHATTFPGFNTSTCRVRYSRLRVGSFAPPSNRTGSDSSHSKRNLCRNEAEIQGNGADLERERIAQQIHDDLGGILTGLKACISVAVERRSQSGFVPDPLLADASALADLAFSTVRKIAYDLQPIILKQMDLWDALECQVAQLARRTGIQFAYFIDASLIWLPTNQELRLIIFRVICEALTNIEKHANASRVSMRIFAEGGYLTVKVVDDGIGFHHGARQRPATLGIPGMKKRALAFGGELAVSSVPSGGTTVRLSLPLARSNGG
ncbi:MAG: domain S-box protein [Massilia sp.]|jgi:two-component system sensor histidine kinase UhpB|nr:domain S-box protein [Massilia sp.]